MKLKLASLTLLGLLLVLTILTCTANVQAQNDSYITIKPANAGAPFYASVGNNWTISFSADWNYGSQTGQPVQNAEVTIDVKSGNVLLETLKFNTTDGVFAFNYSSTNADILTFTPTSLTTQDQQKYTADAIDGVYGLNVESTVVWWDTFQVSLVSFNTDSLGKTVATVNVTYKLLPEEGLTLSNQTFLPKIIHNANVTINGVTATETSPGIFTAESSAWMNDAYVNVKVFQDDWKTTSTAFSFAHNANQQVWMYGLAFISVAIFVAFGLHYAVYRKANNSAKHSNKLFFGFILLMVTSVLSLYWGLIAVEGTMHTFDWSMFALACMFSFIFGIMGSILILSKKLQPLAIFAPVIPLLINTVIVKSALDGYQLANPWLMLLISTLISAVCIIFVSGSDKAFKKPRQTA